ncbi:hypothetical protein ACP70R_019619 [Stipagrostis hirtigluma subsp. patula]
MGWWASMKKALSGDGGGYLRLSDNHPPAPASPTQPAAGPGGGTEASAAGIDAPELTLREVKEATRSFSDARLVGVGRGGQQATVYRASLRGGRAAAAKRLAQQLSPGDAAILKRQLAAASRLRHDNVVRLLGYTISGDLVVLLYEFADLGTLHDALHGPREGIDPAPERRKKPASSRSAAPRRLSWEQRARIALDAARGLEYLHKRARPPVTHTDVRSTNVLLFEGFTAKIADHDLFKQAPECELHAYAVVFHRDSAVYHSPEYAMKGHTTPKFDVYSFGVVLIELLTGRKPEALPWQPGCLLDWVTPMVMENRIEEFMDPKLGGQYPRDEALKLGRIAVQCLQDGPKSRPSMGAVARAIRDDVVRETNTATAG